MVWGRKLNKMFVLLNKKGVVVKIIRENFLKNNIPYGDIDSEMIELLDILNFKWGLKTKFCCYGHNLSECSYVMFDDEIKDEDIYKLVSYLHKEFPNNLKIYKRTKFTSG